MMCSEKKKTIRRSKHLLILLHYILTAAHWIAIENFMVPAMASATTTLEAANGRTATVYTAYDVKDAISIVVACLSFKFNLIVMI